MTRQPVETLAEHRLDARRERSPADRRLLHPGTLRVTDDRRARLEGAQQLDDEQRVGAGLAKQRLAEALAQAVGLEVEQGVDEATALALADLDLDVAELALELVDHRRQRMPPVALPGRQI